MEYFLGFFTKSPKTFLVLPITATCSALHISLNFTILKALSELYKLKRSSTHNVLKCFIIFKMFAAEVYQPHSLPVLTVVSCKGNTNKISAITQLD